MRKYRAKRALERATRRAVDYGLDARAVVDKCLFAILGERVAKGLPVTGLGK